RDLVERHRTSLHGQCALATERAPGTLDSLEQIYSPTPRQQCQEVEQTGNFAPGPSPARKCRRACSLRILAHCNRRIRSRRHACGWPSFRCSGVAGRVSRCALQPAASVTARAPIARIGTETLSPMDALADRREAEPLTHRQTLLIVLGVLLPTFMGSLDQTILATALPTIGRDFGDMHSLPWLFTAHLRLSTAIIPLNGKIADIHGRRFTLRIAILTYMAGSLVCALAPSMLVLIFGRVLHGLGGGGLSSMGMIVLADLVSPKE